MEEEEFFTNTPAPFQFVLLPIKDISRVLKCNGQFMLEVTLLKGGVLKRGGGEEKKFRFEGKFPVQPECLYVTPPSRAAVAEFMSKQIKTCKQHEVFPFLNAQLTNCLDKVKLDAIFEACVPLTCNTSVRAV